MRAIDRNSPAGETDRPPMYGSVLLSLYLLLREGRQPAPGPALSDEGTSSPPQ